MAERAEKIEFIEKNHISSEQLQMLIRFGEEELKRLLEEKQMLQEEKPALGTHQYQFFVSDGAEKFQHFANTIFKYGVLSVKQINIEEY